MIGGGPAGLRAAEVLATRGHPVTLLEAKPYPGRKLLVAGRGGLNVTHSEPLERLRERYLGGGDRWAELLGDFGPGDLREWMHGLGIETYVGSSGRVFPVGDQAARLLRAWLARLEELGVVLRGHHRLLELGCDPDQVRVETPGGPVEIRAGATVLALGGGSWPETGSDGTWVDGFRDRGLVVQPLEPSNCGFELAWNEDFLALAEGRPLKNVAVRAGNREVRGELLVTRYGLEGGSLYQLGPVLRRSLPATIRVDLKPEVSPEQLVRRLRKFRGKGSWRRRAGVAWRLCPVGRALLAGGATRGAPPAPGPETEGPAELAARVKNLPLELLRPRPLAEAISSAGGVAFEELDAQLMLRKRPGTFLAGEMLDWDAPTGGYLLTGCLATGTRAGQGAAAWLGRPPAPRT